MIDQIHRAPDLVILLVMLLVLGGIAYVAPYVGRYALRLRADKARDETVYESYKAVMAMAGVVLAFSLVEANSNYRAAHALVARQASAMLIVDRVLVRSGIADAAKGRPLLDAFGRSQLTDEWPTITTLGRHAVTGEHYNALSRFVRKLEPQGQAQGIMYSELIKAMDDISDSRETLIDEAGNQLPDLFWVMAASFVLLGFVLGTMAEASVLRALSLGSTAAAIGVLLSFVLIMDQPFKGSSSVEPTAIEKILVLNSQRK
jgi:ABC-type multidrug transport system fused ATPase/permease subunit